MSKHTTGPWQAIKVDDDIQAFGIVAEHQPAVRNINDIAAVWKRGGSAKTKANAILIAASPTMLLTLQAIVDEAGPQFGHDDGPGTINRIARLARLAIASATKDQ